jgi:hypothetical protein
MMTARLSGAGERDRLRETRCESVRGGSRAASMRRDGLPKPSPFPDATANLQPIPGPC